METFLNRPGHEIKVSIGEFCDLDEEKVLKKIGQPKGWKVWSHGELLASLKRSSGVQLEMFGVALRISAASLKANSYRFSAII